MTTNTTIFKETEVDDVIEMMGYLTNEVGIDGMLVAPGYQYSQIDPNLTMTRDEHEEKFRAHPRRGAQGTATAGSRAPSTRTSSPATASFRARPGAPSRGTRTAGRAPATS